MSTATRLVPRPPKIRGRTPAAGRDLALARLAKALGHPARVAILRFLSASGDCQCGAIVDRLPLAQATVSQHLKVLKEAGLIRGTIDPPRVCYCIDPETITRLKSLIQEL
jgi:ArsR family transcriptional regulator, arsenate/arsenite/antimonite-responsive transcriptional repressor